MPDEIQPALTPEEWARLPRSVEVAGMPNILDRPILTGDWPAVIALANNALPDDDQRKITREDVLLLLGDRHGGFRADRPELWDAVQRLAAKLAALLPPNK